MAALPPGAAPEGVAADEEAGWAELAPLAPPEEAAPAADPDEAADAAEDDWEAAVEEAAAEDEEAEADSDAAADSVDADSEGAADSEAPAELDAPAESPHIWWAMATYCSILGASEGLFSLMQAKHASVAASMSA